jgi:LmeA-like phospholipid-binding
MYPANYRYQGFQSCQRPQDYQGTAGYPGPAAGPTGSTAGLVGSPAGYPSSPAGYPGSTPGPPGAPPARRRKWPWITVLVILVLLVAADRGANAYAENQMASQFQSSVGLSGKPKVTIEGFPFLTQVIAGDLHKVDITVSNEAITAKSAGSGLLEIASLTATLQGLHPHGTKSATVDQLNANVLVTFSALGNAGGIPQGITLSAAGPNQLKATIDIFGFSSEATATVEKAGSNQIRIHVTDFGGVPADVLGNLADFPVTLPKLPAGLSIQSISVTQQGLRIIVSGQHVALNQ